MYIEKNHRQTQSIIIFSWPEWFSNLGLRNRFLKRISCILALTFLAADTLVNIWRENIPNFVALKTFGWNLLIGLAWWQRFDPTCKKYRNLMSKWLMSYLQNWGLGLHFATILYNPWQATSSLSLVTPSGEKNNSKKASAHTLFWQRHVWENSLPEPSCLWLLRRIWLIQRLVTASHYVFIFCQNQKITSIFKIAAHSQMLYYSCPLKLLDSWPDFLLKSN